MANYKNRPIFGKVRGGARWPPSKNAYFGRVGMEGLGARGVPFYKKTTFESVAQEGARGPTTKKTFWVRWKGGARGLRGPVGGPRAPNGFCRGPPGPPLLLSQKKAFFSRELLVKRSFKKIFNRKKGHFFA